MDNLPAGRELDALVAERVLGKRPCVYRWVGSISAILAIWQCEHGDSSGCYPANAEAQNHPNSVLPHYSERIGDAWLVVDHLTGDGWFVTVHTSGAGALVDATCPYGPCHKHGNVEHNWHGVVGVSADSAPLAVCRTALLVSA